MNRSPALAVVKAFAQPGCEVRHTGLGETVGQIVCPNHGGIPSR
jgi:hypothetical protein